MYNVVFNFSRKHPSGEVIRYRGRVDFRLKQQREMMPVEILEDPKFIPALSNLMMKVKPGTID